MKSFISFFILFCFWSVNAQNRSQEDRPNFILIVADDLGYGDLGTTGSKQIKTPNIDRLDETGMFFTEGYVSSAVCSPSRAVFNY